MTQGRHCQNCGATSQDTTWCSECGAELGDASVRWLARGDAFEISLRVPDLAEPAATPSVDTVLAGDTIPPDETSTDTFFRDPTSERIRPSGSVTALGATRQSTLISAATIELQPLAALQPGCVRTEILTIVEELAELPTKRTWIAEDVAGYRYRVEERSGPALEPVPDLPAALHPFIDVPLGATRRGEREVKVYRHVVGKTLHDRLAERTDPMTPTEIVEWTRPIARLAQQIHDAGFLCLRLCPYTILFTPAGEVFLQGVEVLYPRDTQLLKLPAIAGYTAPEVYEASLEAPPDVRADVYSLAMIVFALIARADPPASMHMGYMPVLSPRDYAPAFPLGFAPVLAALGAQDPAARPRSATDFLAAIEAARERSVRQIPGADIVRLAVAADTHVGVVKRHQNPVNQDAVFVGLDHNGTTSLLVVADGVSTASYGSGDVASSVARACAAQAWKAYLQNPDTVRDRGVRQWLNDLLQRMNAGIIDAVNEAHAPFESEPSDVMGSTCVAAFIQAGIVTLAAIGDSRAYLLRRGQVEQITRDHNLITLGIVDGLDPDTALTFPQGEALARCLGSFDIERSRLVALPVDPDIYVFPLLSGDRLILCSDGLTDYAAEDAAVLERLIATCVGDAELPDLACVDLISAANHGGGGDNVGIAACFADPPFGSPFDWFAARQKRSG